MSTQVLSPILPSRRSSSTLSIRQLLHQNVELLLALITLFFLLVGWIGGTFIEQMPPWAIVFCAVIAYGAGGYSGFTGALTELRQGKLDIDFLMIVAAIGAALIGEWEEGALLLFLFTLSGALEEFAMDRTRQAIQSLAELRPDTARLWKDRVEQVVSVDQLTIGDIVLVRPGERIPVDGLVVGGASSVDQSPITGESIPARKEENDEVFAGTINGGGALEVRVSRLASQSTLSKIIKLVEDAREDVVPVQRFIDRFSQPYTWFVIGLTGLAILIPSFFVDEPFRATFYRAMTLLVVASPCALVISTPASILSAIAAAAREGVLFKGGVFLEKLAHISVAAFDKTGTLTYGKPVVTDVYPFDGFSDQQLLQLAASAEIWSEHHLAQAIVHHARQEKLSFDRPNDFEAIAGHGVRAVFERNGYKESAYVGNDKLFISKSIALNEEVRQTYHSLQQEDKTAVIVVRRRDYPACGEVSTNPDPAWQPVGVIAIADTVRKDAAANLGALRTSGIDQIAMLTGDNHSVARVIADELKIDQVYSELLPEQKVEILRKLREEGQILMVGDGVNDAPALAVADVGIAMGNSGTDAALETADVVLMGDQLSRLPYAIHLSHQAQRIVKQNVFFSIGVMFLLIVLTILVPFFWSNFQLPLPLGVVGHEGSTLLVVANGLRLLTMQAER